MGILYKRANIGIGEGGYQCRNFDTPFAAMMAWCILPIHAIVWTKIATHKKRIRRCCTDMCAASPNPVYGNNMCALFLGLCTHATPCKPHNEQDIQHKPQRLQRGVAHGVAVLESGKLYSRTHNTHERTAGNKSRCK